MARLIVTAFSEDTIAAPGNRRPNYIVVSVTDAHGVPVTGLGVSNFEVDPMIAVLGGGQDHLAHRTPLRAAAATAGRLSRLRGRCVSGEALTS